MFKSPYDPDDIKLLFAQIQKITNQCWCDHLVTDSPCRNCHERNAVKRMAIRLAEQAYQPEPFTYEFKNKEQLNALSKINNA